MLAAIDTGGFARHKNIRKIFCRWNLRKSNKPRRSSGTLVAFRSSHQLVAQRLHMDSCSVWAGERPKQRPGLAAPGLAKADF